MRRFPTNGELLVLHRLRTGSHMVGPLSKMLDLSDTMIRRHLHRCKENGYVEICGTQNFVPVWGLTPSGISISQLAIELEIGNAKSQTL